MRFAQTQVWPALRNFEAISAVDGLLEVGVVEDQYGAWPPSSSDSRLTWSAERRISSLPTSVEPVNEILRTRAVAEQLARRPCRRERDVIEVDDARRGAGVLDRSAG